MDMAQQFLSTVANSSQVVYRRPINDPTTESVLLYTLREEIRATAKTGLDSGLDHNITIKVQLIMSLFIFQVCYRYCSLLELLDILSSSIAKNHMSSTSCNYHLVPVVKAIEG